MNQDNLQFGNIIFIVENVFQPKGKTSDKMLQDVIIDEIYEKTKEARLDQFERHDMMQM